MKPPIGVMPEKIWEQNRAEDLSKAIHEYIKAGIFTASLFMWIEELQKRIRNVIT